MSNQSFLLLIRQPVWVFTASENLLPKFLKRRIYIYLMSNDVSPVSSTHDHFLPSHRFRSATQTVAMPRKYGVTYCRTGSNKHHGLSASVQRRASLPASLQPGAARRRNAIREIGQRPLRRQHDVVLRTGVGAGFNKPKPVVGGSVRSGKATMPGVAVPKQTREAPRVRLCCPPGPGPTRNARTPRRPPLRSSPPPHGAAPASAPGSPPGS